MSPPVISHNATLFQRQGNLCSPTMLHNMINIGLCVTHISFYVSAFQWQYQEP